MTFGQAFFQTAQLNFHNAGHHIFAQWVKENDFIDSVDEFWAEIRLDRCHIGQVAGHDNNRIGKVELTILEESLEIENNKYEVIPSILFNHIPLKEFYSEYNEENEIKSEEIMEEEQPIVEKSLVNEQPKCIREGKDITLVADNRDIQIRDNYTLSKGIKDDNAIYMSSNSATLKLDIKNKNNYCNA